MSMLNEGIILICLIAVLLGSGVWIAMTLAMVGWFGLAVFTGSPGGAILVTTSWSAAASWNLGALPLFILMGEILYRTNLSEQLFRGISPWVGRLPGGLLHVNVLASSLFASMSGSSAATSATVSKIAMPELRRLGYHDNLIIGSLAAGGTLGILIPPSILMVVYGTMTDTSVIRLFLAGVMPGLMLIALFSIYIMVASSIRGEKASKNIPTVPFFEKIKLTAQLLPTGFLIILVIGSMAFGLATATESAALGVVGSLIISLTSGKLTWTTLIESLTGATRLSCMILFIIVCAATLSQAMNYTGLPSALAQGVEQLGVSSYVLLIALAVMYLIFGMFLDGASMIVLTSAVVVPMVVTAGFDLIWFGIFITILAEIAAISPPVGFNLFVLEAVSKRSLYVVAASSLPFVMIMLLGIVVISVFPNLVLWLPDMVMGARR